MVEAEHPNYPHPTIVEALCELHFSRPGGWEAKLPGELFKAIQVEYPVMEPGFQVGVQLQVGAAGIEQRLLPPAQRILFRHAERAVILQISENIFTVNVLAPYPGWSSMRADVLHAWRRTLEVLGEVSVPRIGLRYINRINRTSDEELPGDWLKPNDYTAPIVLQSKPGFLSRSEARLDEANQLLATVAYQEPAEGSPHGALVFDIDRITTGVTSSAPDEIGSKIDRLHEEIWSVFSAARGERLERLLTGDLP
jgi:uncharacterized protein (TIGR04255 family)